MINQTEYLKQSQGSAFKFKDAKYLYRNDLPPEHESNVASVNYLISVNPDLTARGISPLLNSQVVFLKHLILLSLCKDPFDGSAVDDYRNKYFAQAEDGFKQIIRIIADEEDIVMLKTKIVRVSNSSMHEASQQKYLSYLRRRLRKRLGPDLDQDDGSIPKTKYDNSDEEQPASLRRSARLSWIARCKLRLSQLYKSKGSLLDAFNISRENLHEM